MGFFKIEISKADVAMLKLINIRKLLSFGFIHTVSLNKGVEKIYAWYLS